MTAEIVDFAPAITLTGVVAARILTDLSFRLSGKISERLVNVGEHVAKGQVLARLDPEEQQAELVSAEANVASAEAMVRQSAAAFERQKELLSVKDAHNRKNCRDLNGSEPWACSDCDCTRRLEQRLKERGKPFLGWLQRRFPVKEAP